MTAPAEPLGIIITSKELAPIVGTIKRADFDELFDAAAEALEKLRPQHKGGDEGCGCDGCDAWGRLNRAWEAMA